MVAAQDQVTNSVEAAVEFLREQIDITAVYLFGSQVSGDTHEFSDIDLAIFSTDASELGLLGRMKLGARMQLACGDELEPHFFPARALEDPPRGSFAEHVLKEGKRII
ncbi:MAG: nucleotidyltransferase domain-containing protein [Armatimonadota bacterium]